MSKFRMRGGRHRRRESRPDRIPLRAIFPNLITSTAACAGITSIALSSEGRFLPALLARVVASICDGTDGAVARLLGVSSKLGAELDSLADFVNFGVAPAMLMFFWLTGKWFGNAEAMMGAGQVRMVLACALYYAMCDCFRLARFNTMLEQESAPYWKHFFTGVPAPGGCWMVLTPVILSLALDAKGCCPALAAFLQNPWTGVCMLLFVGSLMASRLPTISLKHMHIPRQWLPLVLAALLLLVAFLVSNFWMTIGVVGIGYILTVPVSGLAFLRAREKFESVQGASALDCGSAKV